MPLSAGRKIGIGLLFGVAAVAAVGALALGGLSAAAFLAISKAGPTAFLWGIEFAVGAMLSATISGGAFIGARRMSHTPAPAT